MPHVKGSAITARLRFLRERFGEQGLARVLSALAPVHRSLLDARVLPQDWVPYELFVDLNVEADQAFGRGDYKLCYEMGRFSAEVNLPSIYKLFYRLGNPLFIFQRAARVWRVHYDSGEIEPEDDGTGALRIRIRDFARPHRAHCTSVLGWAARSVELSGGVVLGADEARCRTRGDSVCELAVAWK